MREPGLDMLGGRQEKRSGKDAKEAPSDGPSTNDPYALDDCGCSEPQNEGSRQP